MTIRISLRVALLAGATVALLNSQTSARITGQVRDQRLRPINGARVHAYIVPDGSRSVVPFQTSTLSSSDGGFQLAVPAGTFRICAELRKSELLDTCTWEAPVKVTTVSSQTLQIPPIMLRRGYPLTVRFEDPQSLLPAPAVGKAQPNQVVVGITAPNGMFLPMPIRSRGPAAREHRLMVGRDKSMVVSIHAHGLGLSDDKGSALDAGKGHQFTTKIAGDKAPSTFTFRITGK